MIKIATIVAILGMAYFLTQLIEIWEDKYQDKLEKKDKDEKRI